jgi:hypothetical protein
MGVVSCGAVKGAGVGVASVGKECAEKKKWGIKKGGGWGLSEVATREQGVELDGTGKGGGVWRTAGCDSHP